MRFLTIAVLAALALPASAQLAKPAGKARAETPEQFAKRTKWWREARFGMFIHWGVYAVPADATFKDGKTKGIAEWYFSNKNMQMKEYEKFAPEFNPRNFDAARWVRTAKQAGMKYIVITSKHHDGFGMFGTQMNHDWNIVDATPFKRDPIKELADECKRQGVKLCFYHSIMDWHHPDYLPRRPWEKETRPVAGANPDRYFEQYMKPQIKELITKYHPGVLWFDGEWEETWTHERGKDLYNFCRSLQPSILVNNRVDKGRQGMQGMNASDEFMGDFGTPEQEIPAQGFKDGRLWESCMTMNDTWGYARNDHNWKSSETLIRNLIDIASKGGNYLLNVGPTDLGEFPPEIEQRLADMGRWMEKNGEAIYGTTASPFKRMPFDGRATVKGNSLYLHVFNWPAGGLKLENLSTPIRSATVLDGNQKLTVTQPISTPNAVLISRPRNLDRFATVVELKLAAAPVVIQTDASARPRDDGSYVLQAADAEVHGSSARYETGNGKDNIGYWTNAADFVTWACSAPAAGRYRVHVTYACDPGSDGSEFVVCCGEKGPEGRVQPTGSWSSFKQVEVGELDLPAGKATVAVKIKTMPKGAAMNLKEVRLTPVRP